IDILSVERRITDQFAGFSTNGNRGRRVEHTVGGVEVDNEDTKSSGTRSQSLGWNPSLGGEDLPVDLHRRILRENSHLLSRHTNGFRSVLTTHNASQPPQPRRSEEHTSELQSRFDLVCRLLLEKKKKTTQSISRRLTRVITRHF